MALRDPLAGSSLAVWHASSAPAPSGAPAAGDPSGETPVVLVGRAQSPTAESESALEKGWSFLLGECFMAYAAEGQQPERPESVN